MRRPLSQHDKYKCIHCCDWWQISVICSAKRMSSVIGIAKIMKTVLFFYVIIFWFELIETDWDVLIESSSRCTIRNDTSPFWTATFWKQSNVFNQLPVKEISRCYFDSHTLMTTQQNSKCAVLSLLRSNVSMIPDCPFRQRLIEKPKWNQSWMLFETRLILFSIKNCSLFTARFRPNDFFPFWNSPQSVTFLFKIQNNNS